MTLRQAINKDVLPGDWYIPAGTILLLSMGAMMRYDGVIFVSSAPHVHPGKVSKYVCLCVVSQNRPTPFPGWMS